MSDLAANIFSPDDLEGDYLGGPDETVVDQYVVYCYDNGYDVPLGGWVDWIHRLIKLVLVFAIPVNYIVDIVNGVFNIKSSNTVEVAVGVAMMANIVLVPMLLNFIALLMPRYRIVTDSTVTLFQRLLAMVRKTIIPFLHVGAMRSGRTKHQRKCCRSKWPKY